jgi:small nuclear ribonucleoprotein (snRNP)-like protein
MGEELKRFLNKEVVVDTESRWLYVGTLKKVGRLFITLENVYAHDLTEVALTREQCLINIKLNGLVVNRKSVAVSKERLVGLSLLEDFCV